MVVNLGTLVTSRLTPETKSFLVRRASQFTGEGWESLWRTLAALVLEAERAYKEGAGEAFRLGTLRREWVLEQLKARSAPILARIPDAFEPYLWLLVDGILAEAIGYLNAALEQDWVAQVEGLEDRVLIAIELALNFDVNHDGAIGARPATPPPATPALVGILMVAALLLGAGEVQAVGRYARYSPAPATDVAVEAEVRAGTGANVHQRLTAPTQDPRPVAVPGPRYPRYTPSAEAAAQQREARAEEDAARGVRPSLPLKGVTLESWVGHQPARGGIDAGVGLVRRSGDFCLGVQGAADRVGFCLGWKRAGINWLWNPRDGSWEPGAYLAAVRF